MFAIYNDKSKRADFGLYGKSLVNTEGVNVIVTKGNRRINESQYIEKLKEIAPDLILVCGTSILGNEFLSIPKLGVLNLHGGLVAILSGTVGLPTGLFTMAYLKPLGLLYIMSLRELTMAI